MGWKVYEWSSALGTFDIGIQMIDAVAVGSLMASLMSCPIPKPLNPTLDYQFLLLCRFLS